MINTKVKFVYGDLFLQLFGIIVLKPVFFSAYKLISKSDKLNLRATCFPYSIINL